MSEQAQEEFNPNLDDEADDSPAEEESVEQQPPGDDAKARRALDRMKRERDKARKDLTDLRKQMQEGNPNASESEQLKKEIADLRQGITTSNAISALLEAGFNGDRRQAEKMIRLVDDLGDMDGAIEELKADFPGHFGKGRPAPTVPRPHTGGGRADTAPPRDADSDHVAKLLKMGRK